MAPKRAQFLSYGDDESCAATREFIEKSGVLLDCRDMSKRPLSEYELRRLIGTHSISHFLNKSSEAYAKAGFDINLPDLTTAIKAMAADYTLIRKPIIQAARLITIGCDKRRVSEMLRINGDGENEGDADRRGNERSRRSGHGRNPRHPARAAR